VRQWLTGARDFPHVLFGIQVIGTLRLVRQSLMVSQSNLLEIRLAPTSIYVVANLGKKRGIGVSVNQTAGSIPGIVSRPSLQ
jgi:hypothetical protein